jgi:hypothetical protein
MNRQSLHRAATLAAPCAEWLVLAFLVAASVPPAVLRHESLTIVSKLDLLDGSWLLDTSYKAATGVWFGREVAFTYGPLYQWLSSGPSRWIGISTGTILATAYTLPLFVIILSTFLCARMLLPGASAWRRALLVGLAVVFWSPPDVRTSVCILAFLIFARMADAVGRGSSWDVPPAIAAAIICLAAFFLSADTGLYSVAALLLCVVATVGVHARSPEAVLRVTRFLGLAVICFVALIVVTNAVLFSPLNFQFWRSSLAIAVGYRWFEPTSMSAVEKRLLLEILVMGLAVFAIAWWGREPDGPRWTLRPVFLLSGLGVAFLMMQSGLVRADHAHVLLGIYPMVFLAGAILIGGVGSSRLVSAATVTVVVGVTLMGAHAFPLFLPNRSTVRTKQLMRPILVCPAGYGEFDHACFPPADAELFSAVSTYVDRHTRPPDSMVVFPYQNAFGVMSRRTVAGGVLQGYLVNGDYLTDLDLAGLRQADPPFGLYFPDGTYSVALDGVPSFTRSPELWFYLLHHYAAESSPAPGVLGLVRDNTRDQHLILTEKKVSNALGEIRITKRSTTVNLGRIDWPASGADFLKFRFRANYPVWWKMRKPSALTLQMSFADGSHKSVRFLVEPNLDSNVWVYPWDEKEMGRYFSDDESQWRSGSCPALTSLQLNVSPFDWISVVPESASIGAVEAVRVDLR